MISETQKALVDMLRTKGAQQDVTQLIQTLNTLHWTDEDIRDAAAYATRTDGQSLPIIQSTPVNNAGVAPYASLVQNTTTSSFSSAPTFTSPITPSFTGGTIQIPTARPKRKLMPVYFILAFLIICGVGAFIFKDTLAELINSSSFFASTEQKNTPVNTGNEMGNTQINSEPQGVDTPLVQPTITLSVSTSPVDATTTSAIVSTPVSDSVFQKQISQITTLRKSIATYNMLYGVYPNTLNDLKTTVPVTTFSATTTYPRAIKIDKPILEIIPNDTMTNKPYLYVKGNNDYDLTYTLAIPDYSSNTNVFSSIGIQRFDIVAKKIFPMKRTNATFHDATYTLLVQDVRTYPTRKIVMLVQNGTNTATKHTPSKEMWTQTEIDTDGDTLSDSLEQYIGTNKDVVDSDNDGVADAKELLGKTLVLQ